MKNLFALSLGLIVALSTTTSVYAEQAAAAQVKSGLQDGDDLGPFTVTKVAGAEDDGVAEGKDLCYRCKNGHKPQVVVFTRSTEPQVAELLQKLDAALTAHEEDKLCCFVNVLADDQETATANAKKFALTSKTKNIPFVVPNEFENGPDNYGINPKAAVTVTLAANGKVAVSHGFASADDINVDAVIKDLSKILN